MTKDAPAPRTGKPVVFTCAVIFVIICVALGIYYLLPGFYHPLTSDTATHTYAHLTYALGIFVCAVMGLIIMRLSRPGPNDGTMFP